MASQQARRARTWYHLAVSRSINAVAVRAQLYVNIACGLSALLMAWLAAGMAGCAGGKVGSLVSRVHQAPSDARHLRENQDMVVKALQVRSAVTDLRCTLACKPVNELSVAKCVAAVAEIPRAMQHMPP